MKTSTAPASSPPGLGAQDGGNIAQLAARVANALGGTNAEALAYRATEIQEYERSCQVGSRVVPSDADAVASAYGFLLGVDDESTRAAWERAARVVGIEPDGEQ
jgi:hypothetical protein